MIEQQYLVLQRHQREPAALAAEQAQAVGVVAHRDAIDDDHGADGRRAIIAFEFAERPLRARLARHMPFDHDLRFGRRGRAIAPRQGQRAARQPRGGLEAVERGR